MSGRNRANREIVRQEPADVILAQVRSFANGLRVEDPYELKCHRRTPVLNFLQRQSAIAHASEKLKGVLRCVESSLRDSHSPMTMNSPISAPLARQL